MITTRILVPLLAISLSLAPVRAMEPEAELTVDVAEQQQSTTTYWKDAKTVAKGMLLLACAYKLYTPLKKSYKHLGSQTSTLVNQVKRSASPRRGPDAFMASAGIGTVGTNSGSSSAPVMPGLKLGRAGIVMPSSTALVYTSGMVACATLGIDYIVRGLHLEKPVADAQLKVCNAMRDFYTVAKNKALEQASRLKR